MKISSELLFALALVSVIAWLFYQTTCETKAAMSSMDDYDALIWPDIPAEEREALRDDIKQGFESAADMAALIQKGKLSEAIDKMPLVISGIHTLLEGSPSGFAKAVTGTDGGSELCIEPDEAKLLKNVFKGDLGVTAVDLNKFFQRDQIEQILDWLNRLVIAANDCGDGTHPEPYQTLQSTVFRKLSGQEAEQVIGSIVINLDGLVTEIVDIPGSGMVTLSPLVLFVTNIVKSLMRVNPEGLVSYLRRRDIIIPYCRGKLLYGDKPSPYPPTGLPSLSKDEIVKAADYLSQFVTLLPQLLPWVHDFAQALPACEIDGYYGPVAVVNQYGGSDVAVSQYGDSSVHMQAAHS